MNPAEKKAAALMYDPALPAPLVSASGKGREAERILRAAVEAGVTIVEDSGLAALLDGVRPGDYIPVWCWEAAAKILAFVRMKSFETPAGRWFSKENNDGN